MAKFNKEMIENCAAWVRENGLMEYGGATLKEFCGSFCINSMTYYRWMEKADFADAIKNAKDEYKNSIGRDVFISLAKAAKGYEYEQTSREYTTVKGDVVRTVTTTTTKRVEPNVTAGIFLLKNLDPEHFKDVQRQEITGRDGETLKMEQSFTGFNFLPYTPEADELRDKG